MKVNDYMKIYLACDFQILELTITNLKYHCSLARPYTVERFEND